MAVIRTDAPVDLDLDDVPPVEFTPERMEHLRSTFERFEFGSLLRRLEEVTGEAAPAVGPRTPRPPPPWRRCPRTCRCGSPGIGAVALEVSPEGWAVATDGDEVPTATSRRDRRRAGPGPVRARGRLPRRQGGGAATGEALRPSTTR